MTINKEDPILITGGTGFLGSHVISQLLNKGFRIRNVSHTKGLSTRVEWIEGSLLDSELLLKAMTGCGAVFHLAGRVSRDRRQAQALYHLHVNGTEAVIRTAAQAGVSRVIYVSTSGTIACSRNPQSVATEETPYPIEMTQNWPYYVSKIEAEKRALSLAKELKIELICLNPSLLLGPGDGRLSSTEDILKIVQKKIPAIPSGGLNFVDVRDVAKTAISALEIGKSGERYLLGTVNWSLAQFIQRVGELAQVPTPKWKAPDTFVRGLAICSEPLFHLLALTPPLDVVSAEMSQVFWYFDNCKARKELGFSPRPVDETLQDTLIDLRERKIIIC